jgi:hypothetical protein
MRTPGVEPGPLAGQDPKSKGWGRQQTRPYHTRSSVFDLRIGSVVPFSLQLSPVPAQVRHRCNAGRRLVVRSRMSNTPSKNSTGRVEQRRGSAGSASSTRS